MMRKQSPRSVEQFLKRIIDEKIENIDFRFTDTIGYWHHMTFHVDGITRDIFENGIGFDGSSIKGWRPIENSDMIMMPDLSTTCWDPFSTCPTLVVICSIIDPESQKGYIRDPRSIAKKAEAYLQTSGVGTQAYFGPEPEFFIFDRVSYGSSSYHSHFDLNSHDAPETSEHGSFSHHLGHYPHKGSGYAPCAPLDAHGDLRSEMLQNLKAMGLGVLKHHHEVASCQHELGFDFSTLIKTADQLQKFKYCIFNTCQKHDKTATFMPKPIIDDNGSGMHVHQSLWKEETPLFYGQGYNHLSDTALHYIGGILKHAKSLNAFTNPTTNSYRRLIPGFEAPTFKAFSAKNRSAAIRIPHSTSEKAKRIEVRFPDPMANPYLALSAMLMAGLDGIQNKIEPGRASDENLYELKHADPEACLAKNLDEALAQLKTDHDYLLAGDVFSRDQIEAYIDLKQHDLDLIARSPTSAEFELYYSL